MAVMKNICILICWFLMGAVAQGEETNPVFTTSYFIDRSNQQSIQTIESQNFSLYKNELRLGYTDNPIWIKIDTAPLFRNLTTQANPLKLRVGPYFTDRIEKYERINQEWQTAVKGALLKESNESCSEDAHCFSVLGNPSIPNVIYLKIQSRGVIYLQVDVMHAEKIAFLNIDKIRQSTASIGVAVLLLISTFLFFVYRPSYLVFSYVCLQFIIVFNLIYSNGLLTSSIDFLTPSQLKEISYFLTCLRAALIAQLVYSLLKNYDLTRGYRVLMCVVLLLTALDVVLLFLGFTNWALKFQLAIHLFNIFVQLYGLKSSNISHKFIKNLLFVSTLAYAFLFIMGVSNIMGLTEISAPLVVQYYSNLNGTMVGSLLLIVGVYQARLRRQEAQADLEKLRILSNEAQLSKEKLNERTTLIDLLTHELMNPLGAIKFLVESLKHPDNIEDTPNKKLNRIESSVNRMKDLIAQVALSNRLELHQIEYPLEVLDARQTIEDLIGDYADETRFALNIEPGLCFYSNPILLGYVLKNLIDNAYKYDSKEKKISISVFKADGLNELTEPSTSPLGYVAFFEISNSFDPTQKPDELQIFERYYRHENVMTKPGMGIGLSIVKTALNKLNKEIQFSISESQATFKLTI